MNIASRFEVVENQRYKNTKTGQTASIYGAAPSSDMRDWITETTGYTVRDNQSGTVGYPSIPFGASREFCENHIVKLQKLHTKGTRILQRKSDGKLQLQWSHLYNGQYLFLQPNDHWQVLD